MMVFSLMAPNHVTMTVFLVTFTEGRSGLRNVTQALRLTYHSGHALGIRSLISSPRRHFHLLKKCGCFNLNDAGEYLSEIISHLENFVGDI